MKNFLILGFSVTAAYLLGRGRAQKTRRTTELLVEVKADTSQAIAALDELNKKSEVVTANIVCRGEDMQAALNYATYRAVRTT
ncbi:hypothetical protein [Hymenobacter convexus]|uniref:hypothetical protein n=1 Tax=Hymenobacter sp. CA1UV-4 TaxID=3063782 RepID=UPI0027136DEC|nr:hypothetical protein [Hymenobacter sp. CA1UV-4]MDO7851397.1 hypothetical protein [Hymenobacter sp. CA1UV-4]